MSGSDLRDLIIDPLFRQARRLACGKGLIALGLCMLVVVLPVCLARSRNGVTMPTSRSDTPVGRPLPTDSPNSPGSDSILAVWSELPGASADQSLGAAKAIDSEPSVESFTAYPSPTPSAASSTAGEKQQLVEEIRRRLARMKAGATAIAVEQPNPMAQKTETISRPSASNPSLGLDADAPLQLFQPTGPVVPAEAGRASSLAPKQPREDVVTKSLLEDHLMEVRRDPNLNSNPAAQAAFTRHFEAAKALQQQGQYVRAADAFTLALAYRPTDAGAYLGKGHALFAAGQYTGSAAALARAVELDSQAALKKVDLVKIAGGPDEFIAKFNDLARHAEADPAPEQYFLLAYIYYQMDQLDQAKTAIEAARKGSTSQASAEILRTAICR